MTVAHERMTADALLHAAKDGFRYELVRGELIRMSPAGFQHGRIIMNIATPLDQHVRRHRLGVVCAAETGFLIARDPDTVRAADVAFLADDQVATASETDSYWPGAPTLAVEVVSPHDLYTEVDAKVSDWLDAGTRMVIIINPRKRTVTVYRSASDITLLRERDLLEGADVIPNWSLAVADIFA